MKKILFWGDSPTVATGLGNVSRNILSSLKNYDITVIGVNDRGGWKDPKQYPYKIYPCIFYPYDDNRGAVRLLRLFQGKDPEIKENDFDIFLTNLDFFLFNTIKINNVSFLSLIREAISSKTERIIYTPIDNDCLFPSWIKVFDFFDKIIVPSYFGRSVLKKYNIKSDVVYYPLDTENFYKKEMSDKPKDKFIIGYVGRNQWRKDLHRLIYIFSLFKKKYNNTYLYIHTQPQDKNQQGWDLFELAHIYGLKNGVDYYFPDDINENIGKERKKMVDVYNYFDVFLSTSTGEGYGLPYAEASLCEVPVLIADNSVAFDFKNVLTIYKTKTFHSFGWIDGNRIRPLADEFDCLEKLEDIYKNKEKYQEKAKKAREFFLQFNHSYFSQKFNTLLTNQK